MYNIFTQKSIWLFSLKYQHKRYNNCPSCVLNTETPTCSHTPSLRSLWLWESLKNLHWSSQGLAELELRIWWQRLLPRIPWWAAQETGPDPSGGRLGQKPRILVQHLLGLCGLRPWPLCDHYPLPHRLQEGEHLQSSSWYLLYVSLWETTLLHGEIQPTCLRYGRGFNMGIPMSINKSWNTCDLSKQNIFLKVKPIIYCFYQIFIKYTRLKFDQGNITKNMAKSLKISLLCSV